jgi:regulator of sigma E protease
MLTTLYVIVVVLILFGITIFVHELGHFLVARWCGLVVETFSIGFGPALWKRRRGGTTYKIGCIPFGGYVALPQLDPSGMDKIQGKPDPAAGGADTPAPQPLPPASPGKRILVSAAGAVGNLILAVILAWVVFIAGKPATPSERSATVGYVMPDSQAYARGLRVGDEVLSVNGEAVQSWMDFLIAATRFTNVTLRVRRDGAEQALSIPTETGLLGEQTLRGVDGRSLCMILSVDPNQSAGRAGLIGGDIITALDGIEIISRAQLIALVGERAGQTVPITVKRNGEPLTLQVTPTLDPVAKQVRIGVQFNITDIEFDEIVHPRPGAQLRSHATAILRHLFALTTPSQAKAASGALGGPLAILINYYFIVRASLMVAVFFTGFLNVNLAILNLLPIPVLDGGHILFALWEAVTRRRVDPRIVNWATNIFAVLLIGVMILLTGRDIRRFTPVGRYLSRWTDRTEATTNTTSQTPAPAEPATPAEPPAPAPAPATP